jgi:hypothetical protein
MATQREIVLVQAPPLSPKTQVTPPAKRQSQPVTIDSIQQPVKVQDPVIIRPQQPIDVRVPSKPLLNEVLPDLITLIGAIATAGVSAYVGWKIAKYSYDRQLQDRIDEQKRLITFQLFEEFNSESMWRSRVEADKKFVPIDGSKPRDIRKDYDTMPTHKLGSIFRVIYFYKRLESLREEERIDVEIAKEIFSDIYRWWFDNYLIYQMDHIENDAKWKGFIVKYDWLYNYKSKRKKELPEA